MHLLQKKKTAPLSIRSTFQKVLYCILQNIKVGEDVGALKYVLKYFFLFKDF